MQISNNMCKPQSTVQPAFQSRFIPNDALRRVFENTGHGTDEFTVQENRRLVNAIKSIIYDGKDDEIKVTENRIRSSLYVNGNSYGGKKSYPNWGNSGCGTKNAIIDYAARENGVKKVFGYDSLTKSEIYSIENQLNMLKTLTPLQDNFVTKIGEVQNLIKFKVASYAESEIIRLKNKIFNIKQK